MDLIVKKCVTEEGLLLLKDRWQELADLHTKFEWFYYWWLAKKEKYELYVLTVEKNNQVLAIMPLVREKVRYLGLPVKCLQFISGDLPNEILIGNQDIKNSFRACLNFLYCNRKDWDKIYIKFLDFESAKLQQLLQLLNNSHIPYLFETGNTSPYIKVNKSWEEYYNSLSKKFRSTINNRLNKFRKSGTFEIVTYNKPENVKIGLAEIFQIADKSWQGQIDRAISSERDSEFFSKFVKVAAIKNWLDLRVLKFNKVPIAFSCSVIYSDTFFGVKTGYDPEYSKFSPGTILIYHMFRDLYKSGIKEFNLLGTPNTFKMKWTDLIRQYYNITIFRKELRFFPEYVTRKKIIKRIKKNRFLSNLSNALKNSLTNLFNN